MHAWRSCQNFCLLIVYSQCYMLVPDLAHSGAGVVGKADYGGISRSGLGHRAGRP